MHTHGIRSLPSGTKDFERVRNSIQARAEMALTDVTVSLDKLRFTDLQTVEVPGRGHYELTTWSRNQLASLLGIRWGKWFETAEPREVAEEVNRRFERAQMERKVRLCRHPRGESHLSDGVLRGFCGPKYSPIDDVQVMDSLALHLAEEVQFVRVSRTERSTQYGGVMGRPVDLGMGEADWVYAGFLIRNSEVGFASLTIDTFVYRLVCTNGLMVMEDGERLLYRQHRPISPERLDGMLENAFSQIAARTVGAVQRLGEARRHPVLEPETVLERLVRDSALPAGSRGLVIDAFREEPEATKFGVVQALTRAAQKLTPEDGFEMEQLAGRYLTAS